MEQAAQTHPAKEPTGAGVGGDDREGAPAPVGPTLEFDEQPETRGVEHGARAEVESDGRVAAVDQDVEVATRIGRGRDIQVARQRKHRGVGLRLTPNDQSLTPHVAPLRPMVNPV